VNKAEVIMLNIAQRVIGIVADCVSDVIPA